MKIHIKGGRLLSKQANLDTVADLFIADGQIVGIGEQSDFTAEKTLDAQNQLVVNGIVDLTANCLDSSFSHHKRYLEEASVAAKSGITTLCIPPDTSPIIDNAAVVELIQSRTETACCEILPIASMTQQLQGQQLTEMAALKAAGCPVVGNANHPIANTRVLKHCMEYAASFNLPLFYQANDFYLTEGGIAHEGLVSNKLGLKGISDCSESIDVARALLLLEHSGGHLHFTKVSSAKSVALIRKAKAEGLSVTADTAIAHLYLTDQDIDGFNNFCHVQPPLRGLIDQEGLLEGLRDGTLDAICSDHKPCDITDKLMPFAESKPGISTLEVFLPLTLNLSHKTGLGLEDVFDKIIDAPRQILNLPSQGITVGSKADLCLIAPDETWQLTQNDLKSFGKNCPFIGWPMQGKVMATMLQGQMTYCSEQ